MQRVIEKTTLSRGSVYRFVNDGSFPQPIQLGPKLQAWWEDEVDAWLESRPRGLHSAEDARRVRRSGGLSAVR